ncbi:hypothetical protein Tco_0362589 [Tanacetum coccineum]
MTLLLYSFIMPLSTGNFNIPYAVDGTARIFLMPDLPIIALCWDGDMITMKFIHAEVECTSSPILTSKAIWPSGQMVSLLNPISNVRIRLLRMLRRQRISCAQSVRLFRLRLSLVPPLRLLSPRVERKSPSPKISFG